MPGELCQASCQPARASQQSEHPGVVRGFAGLRQGTGGTGSRHEKPLLLACSAAQQGKSPSRVEEAAPVPPTQDCHLLCF